ncbi:carboxymuconolactone decarboxylase family protein [Coralloluteibacterium stylophorae]|uniref:Carboxymuconolactone decarboxylase family protein n=1 Tax=Coralloluteibacterium stylophorae TaxID=1776034 RepID=A0A8J7VRK6_9GAMM|nr:carboxymuconolactone decarboxylase family protein [Coralloluteibacterium stylophorae]MBS7457347.1 carboxymuconolactone decarboxylase family protein [Coralloluteibacterium stylophorae]
MSRIPAIPPEQAAEAARAQLEAVGKSLGMVPNAFRTLANSPAALGGYLALNQATAKSTLSARERETVALATSEVNGCDYCLAAHSLGGRKAGLDAASLLAARRGDLDAFAALARRITERRGRIDDADLAAARAAGLGDAQIVDVIAQVALLTFTNYLNNVAQTELDFPAVAALADAAPL